MIQYAVFPTIDYEYTYYDKDSESKDTKYNRTINNINEV